MADYEKEISSLVKEILKTSEHLDKQKKLPKNQEPVATVSELNDAEPDSAAPIQEAQTKTSMGKGKFEKEQEMHELISDYFLASTYVLKEPRKLHEPKFHHSDVRVEIVKSANIFEFELDCLCAKNDSKRVGLFFEDILVYNTFFDKPVAQLKLEFTDSECKERGYHDQSINDESLAKLEMQQSNLGSCLAASFDIGAVRGSYLRNQKDLSNKLNGNGNLTHQGEHAKVTNHVFKSSLIDYTDMMHLFLPKESCADYMEALKNAKRKNKREEDKRFKPPDLSLERHQDVTCFILIKEAPPDAAYKPKPRKDNFGIRLLLYDDFACVNLSCFNVSGLSNASGVTQI
ncbi:hypothetical protein YC2023_094298 [Brassica napus]